LFCSLAGRELRSCSHGHHRGRHDDRVRQSRRRAGPSASRQLLRRRPGPEGAPVRGHALGARRAGHRQADREGPRRAASAAHPSALGSQVQRLAGAHVRFY
jgi:hypothetical protein